MFVNVSVYPLNNFETSLSLFQQVMDHSTSKYWYLVWRPAQLLAKVEKPLHNYKRIPVPESKCPNHMIIIQVRGHFTFILLELHLYSSYLLMECGTVVRFHNRHWSKWVSVLFVEQKKVGNSVKAKPLVTRICTIIKEVTIPYENIELKKIDSF